MKTRRSARGSALAEFAPAVCILFLFILFPLINLACLTLSFGGCWYLNYLQTREASVTVHVRGGAITNQKQVDDALAGVREQWLAIGLAQFAHAAPGNTTVDFESTGFVTVKTNITVQPFVTIPLPVSAPGLNAPITFSLASQRPVEDIL